MATLAQLGEDALIRRLTAGLQTGPDVVTGVGDDCAVVRVPGPGWLQLLKADCLVEGVHFLRETPPEQVGWKAMARAISDIAAMAGMPQHALVTLILPPELEAGHVDRLYAGLRSCADKFGVQIVGGETSRGPQIVINISLTGKVKRSRLLQRDGARAGDAIFVTGRLGGSLHGHHLTFTPRLIQARWLAANITVHAMMDLSDGLARDLPRMAGASGVDYVIDEDTLPLQDGCSRQQAWSDGEDYELLFAVPAHALKLLGRAWSRLFQSLPLTRIGTFVLKGEGRPVSFESAGWEHFSPPHPP